MDGHRRHGAIAMPDIAPSHTLPYHLSVLLGGARYRLAPDCLFFYLALFSPFVVVDSQTGCGVLFVYCSPYRGVLLGLVSRQQRYQHDLTPSLSRASSTVLAGVLYGAWWTWVNPDVKRVGTGSGLRQDTSLEYVKGWMRWLGTPPEWHRLNVIMRVVS